MLLFEAIKNRSMEALEAAALADDVNGQDKSGRTPLHYIITQKAPLEMFAFCSPREPIRNWKTSSA
ncbi:hypothetical protein NLX71_06480 [Paenibacillus sp. MZ04-78.2]|uniref:hypothetical protein n=1 Tax=Paenibacillus sp. MZ04-78.2 TaxID=2962034 RepID=UPI0020B7E4EC|nr:hypothetical protein [Paenibacillus sp. MZ04-78.2]MCP3772970.1 hypothetical protein [Paenibacillus sp. MZ04-78.2]